MYPTHAESSKIIPVLNNFGISYPIKEWDDAFYKILNLVTSSLTAVCTQISNRNK